MKAIEFFKRVEELRETQGELMVQVAELNKRIDTIIDEAWEIDAGDVTTVKAIITMLDKLDELRGREE